MTNKSLNEALRHAGDVLMHLKATRAALESTGQAPEPGSPRAKAIQAVQAALDQAEVLAHNLGGALLPVRH